MLVGQSTAKSREGSRRAQHCSALSRGRGKRPRDSHAGPLLHWKQCMSQTYKEGLNDAQLQVHLTTVMPSNKRATRVVIVRFGG